jgi:hypothetical protein
VVDRSLALRAAFVQAAAVAVLSIALVAITPDDFFEDWGWIAGPGAWATCALITAGVLRLPWAGTLGGAAVAAVPSLLGVIVGVHWLGASLAVAAFGLWCGRLAADRGLPDEIV